MWLERCSWATSVSVSNFDDAVWTGEGRSRLSSSVCKSQSYTLGSQAYYVLPSEKTLTKPANKRPLRGREGVVLHTQTLTHRQAAVMAPMYPFQRTLRRCHSMCQLIPPNRAVAH